MIKPMLAEDYSKDRSLPKSFFVQPKIDGIRCLVNCATGRIVSREGNVINVPHLTYAAKIGVNVTLDAELYIHDEWFENISSGAKTIRSPYNKLLKLMVFDIVVPVKFSERIRLYEEITELIDSHHVESVPAVRTDKSKIDFFHRQFVEHKFEGTIIRMDTPYEHRRTWNMMKIKEWHEMDCRVTGLEEEGIKTGTGHNTLGAFVLETPAGVRVTAAPKDNLGTMVMKKKIWNNPSAWIGKIVIVKYQKLMKSGSLRHPNVVGRRFEQGRHA